MSSSDVEAASLAQLSASGLPRALWSRLLAKVKAEAFDVGSTFHIEERRGATAAVLPAPAAAAAAAADSADSGASEGGGVQLTLVATEGVAPLQDVWLVDHAVSFTSAGQLAAQLKASPSLKNRVAGLLGLCEEDDEDENQEDEEVGEAKKGGGVSIAEATWRVTGSYTVATSATERLKVYFIMDEVGCSLVPSLWATSHARVGLFVDPATGMAFSFFWLAQTCPADTAVTAWGLPHMLSRAAALRNALRGFSRGPPLEAVSAAAGAEAGAPAARSEAGCGDAASVLGALGVRLRALGYGESLAALAGVLGLDLQGCRVLPIWALAGAVRNQIVARLLAPPALAAPAPEAAALEEAAPEAAAAAKADKAVNGTVGGCPPLGGGGKESGLILRDCAKLFFMNLPLPRKRVVHIVGGEEVFHALASPDLGLLVPEGNCCGSGGEDAPLLGQEPQRGGQEEGEGEELWSCTVLLAPSGGGGESGSGGDRAPLLLFGDHFHVSGPVSQACGVEPVMYVGPDSAALSAVLLSSSSSSSSSSTPAPTTAPTTPPSLVVAGKRVLDLCCGGGVQGLTALVAGAQSARLVERSPRACSFARANACLNGLDLRVQVVEGDATDWRQCVDNRASSGSSGSSSGSSGSSGSSSSGSNSDSGSSECLPSRLFDVVLLNPPYIPSDGAPRGSLTAFGDGGCWGEEFVTAPVVANLPNLLRPDGGVFLLVANLVNAEGLPTRLRGWLNNARNDEDTGGGGSVVHGSSCGGAGNKSTAAATTNNNNNNNNATDTASRPPPLPPPPSSPLLPAWQWSVLHGKPWSVGGYAALILSADEASGKCKAYAKGMAAAGVASVTNGFIVGVTSSPTLPPPTLLPRTQGAPALPTPPHLPPPLDDVDDDAVNDDTVRIVHDELWVAVTRGDAEGEAARRPVLQAAAAIVMVPPLM